MKQPFPVSGASALSNSAVRYLGVAEPDIGGQAAEITVQNVVALAGVFANLKVNLDAAPGAGTSYTFVLNKNGNPTDVTCAISGTATTAEDTTHTATFAAADFAASSVTSPGTS